MAQLKDSIISGNLRVTDTTLTDTLQVTTVKAPTTSGGTTYGPGTSGQVLKSNGTTIYWGSDSNSVTGVKGNIESSYRTGNVNLTPANIGALALTGGTVSSSTFGTQITVERTGGANMAALGFKNTAGMLGYIATNEVDGDLFHYGADTSKKYTILDTNNLSTYANYVPNTQTGMNSAINLLSIGSADPQLADYYIAQYAGGGTATTTYHRRPISALWNTFKSLITINTTGSGNAVTSVSIANDGNNRKITFTKGSTFLTSHQSVTDGNPTLAWGTQSTVATIGGTDIHVTMPTDAKVTQTSSSSDTDFPILLAASSQTSTSTTYFSSDVIINPSGPQIKCGWNNSASSFVAIDMSGQKGSVGFKSHFEQANGTTLEYQRSCIRAIPGKVTGDAGLLLKIDSGGMVIIGSGESGLSLTDLIDDDQSVSGAAKLNIAGALNTSYVGDDEQMIVASDNNIYFITNCQTITDRKAAALTTSLEFHPDTTGTGAIGTSEKHWNTAYINTINGNLTGNVTGDCSGNAGTSTKTYHTVTNPPSNTTYGITFHASANSAGNKDLLTNNSLRLTTLEGTTTDLGYGFLLLGNATASGTTGNKYGGARFFTTGVTYIQLDSGLDTTTLRFSHYNNTTGANFSPKTTNKYDIGQSSLRWRNIYATTIDNSGSYFIVNGTRIYVGSTAPTGTIPEGSLWLNTAVINS